MKRKLPADEGRTMLYDGFAVQFLSVKLLGTHGENEAVAQLRL